MTREQRIRLGSTYLTLLMTRALAGDETAGKKAWHVWAYIINVSLSPEP
jgi:hypothetical protein